MELDATTTAQAPSERRLLGRMVRFGIVGASGVLVNLGLLALFVELLGWHYAFASILAIEASILTNYALNHIWTWRGGDNGLHTFLNFQLVSLVGMALQWGVLTFGVAGLDVHYMLAALAGIGLATIWNFAANHWFTFAEKSKDVVRRHRIGWMYVGAASLQILAAALLVHSWDGFVFTRTVENFV
ncbi:MAG TPA: GtrA family protein, partial [Candidatus Thermoplasmatota archaeon]